MTTPTRRRTESAEEEARLLTVRQHSDLMRQIETLTETTRDLGDAISEVTDAVRDGNRATLQLFEALLGALAGRNPGVLPGGPV